MKQFEHVTVSSFEEGARILKEGKGKRQAMAGGSDLLGIYKDGILKTHPETVVNLKQIPEFDTLEETDGWLDIGAGCKLNRIAGDRAVKDLCPALAEAAYSVASPLIRSIGTVGGNICQDVRCWYYRYPDTMGGALDCKRKGGKPAMLSMGRTAIIPCLGEWPVMVPHVPDPVRRVPMCRLIWQD